MDGINNESFLQPLAVLLQPSPHVGNNNYTENTEKQKTVNELTTPTVWAEVKENYSLSPHS